MGSRKRPRGSNRGSVLFVVILAAMVFVGAFFYSGRSHSAGVTGKLECVEIDLDRGVELRPVISRSGALFSEITDRYHPYAAINGTYYNAEMRPLGDILIDGKLRNRGHYRNAVALTRDGKIVFLHRKKGRLDWTGCLSGIAAGPRLIHNGRIALSPVADGFSRRSLTLEALRSGIGRTKSGKLILVSSKERMTLAEFAHEMLRLGAVEGMNLDGGSACGLYCDGETLIHPTIPMTNMLLVFKKDR